jgi:hypothetical protein
MMHWYMRYREKIKVVDNCISKAVANSPSSGYCEFDILEHVEASRYICYQSSTPPLHA